jgi:hypothetical protein
MELRSKGRIEDGELCPGIQKELVGTGVVDGYIHDKQMAVYRR